MCIYTLCIHKNFAARKCSFPLGKPDLKNSCRFLKFILFDYGKFL